MLRLAFPLISSQSRDLNWWCDRVGASKYFLCSVNVFLFPNWAADALAVAAYACALTRSLTPHTHPPKGTILIYNLLFCISRFVLFFFRFVDFSIIFMCDLEWHFDSGYFISSFECLNTCAYCTWNVSEDVLVYRVMCFAYNTLFACCFFSRVVALNQMKFIISSWISFTLCAHILRPCFFFFLSVIYSIKPRYTHYDCAYFFRK